MKFTITANFNNERIFLENTEFMITSIDIWRNQRRNIKGEAFDLTRYICLFKIMIIKAMYSSASMLRKMVARV